MRVQCATPVHQRLMRIITVYFFICSYSYFIHIIHICKIDHSQVYTKMRSNVERWLLNKTKFLCVLKILKTILVPAIEKRKYKKGDEYFFWFTVII